jgi:kynurenine 3-monooxygenase
MEKIAGSATSDYLDHDYKELEIPAGTGGSWQLEKEALHIWPRGEFMLIALPNLDRSFTVTLFLPKRGRPSFESLQNEQNVSEFFDEVFPTAKALMPDLVSEFFNNPAGRLGTVRCAPWHFEDRCLLLGDAAHAIVPFHGQGMNAAFEDCVVLDQLLDKHDDDWTKVNPEMSVARKPDVDAIAQMAIENYTTMRSTVTDPKYGLKKAVGFELERRFPELFIPRYSMVMFHNISYAEALERGQMQNSILDELVDGVDSIQDVNWDAAEAMVKRCF